MDLKKLSWMSKRIEEIDKRVEKFWNKPSWENAPVLQVCLGNMYKDCRTSESSFKAQMESIGQTLSAKTDWMPFLEPWHGVGIYAELFGCKYEWDICDYPQTYYAISSVEEASKIRKPDWRKGEIAQLVMNSIKYFKEQAGDSIPISLTDTQSSMDTATLIWETESFFVACFEEPEVVHRFLDMITDVKIEFSLAQIEAIGANIARPGHNAALTRPWGKAAGIGLSDDLATVVSPAIYEEFCVPYNEKMAKALGGVVIHSCGVWNKIMPVIQKTEGLMGAELALSLDEDPSPSVPEAIRDGFKGTGIPVKARMGKEFMNIIDRVYHPDLIFIPHIYWAEDQVQRDGNYEMLHQRMEELISGKCEEIADNMNNQVETGEKDGFDRAQAV